MESECADVESKTKAMHHGVRAEINFELLENGLVNISENVKILVVKNCINPSKFVISPRFVQILRSSHIFVIIIRFSSDSVENELEQISDEITEPIILQLDSVKSSRLFLSQVTP